MEEFGTSNGRSVSGTVPARPVAYALTKNALGILRAFAISGLGSITYYVGITYVPAFLVSTGKLKRGRLASAIHRRCGRRHPRHAVCGILSDRVGRKPVLIALTACSADPALTLFPSARGARERTGWIMVPAR